MARSTYSRRTSAALLAVFVACLLAATVLLAPGTASAAGPGVASAQSSLDRAVARHARAQRQLDALEREVIRRSENLDRLARRRDVLQARLDMNAAFLYRQGRFTVLALLFDSRSIEEFTSRWELLARVALDDARTIRELEALTRRSSAAARQLLVRQAAASRRVRALRAETARARKELASSYAAYAEYRQRIAAAQARRPKPHYPPEPELPRASRRAVGGWRIAGASHYGHGSIGHHTADGTRIAADSMIVAHKTLPFGTLVEFEFNGRRAIGRVADRGPYVHGREWDLGPGLVNVLDFNGVHNVRYRIVGR